MMDENKPFPIQQDTNWGVEKDHRPIIQNSSSSIPWWLAEVAYREYAKKFGKAQSLERLAERGGFGRSELVWLLSENVYQIKSMKNRKR